MFVVLVDHSPNPLNSREVVHTVVDTSLHSVTTRIWHKADGAANHVCLLHQRIDRLRGEAVGGQDGYIFIA
ncbi:MAG: hypothetical protein R2788_20485 [Saprospiraceae bacterium]